MKQEKILQVVNLAPSESVVEKIVEVHPMKQIAIMSVIQVVIFFMMLGSMVLIGKVFK